MCPLHPEPPRLPPHPIPPGHHRAPGLVSLCYTPNFHWLLVLHMVMYMLQCYSLKSSHPLLLSLSQKICSLFLPGKFHGQRNLAGYSPWGRKESDVTYWLNNKNASSKCKAVALMGLVNITGLFSLPSRGNSLRWPGAQSHKIFYSPWELKCPWEQGLSRGPSLGSVLPLSYHSSPSDSTGWSRSNWSWRASSQSPGGGGQLLPSWRAWPGQLSRNSPRSRWGVSIHHRWRNLRGGQSRFPSTPLWGSLTLVWSSPISSHFPIDPSIHLCFQRTLRLPTPSPPNIPLRWTRWALFHVKAQEVKGVFQLNTWVDRQTRCQCRAPF